MNFDQGKFQEAIPYYELFFIQMTNNCARCGSAHPITLAELLEEFSEANRRTGDDEKAQTLKKQTEELRKGNPTLKSNNDHTPYGKYCD